MIKAIDFFCGAGGLTRGLLDAGIQVLAGVDNDARLRQTYEHNNKPSSFVHSKIEDIDIEKLRTELGIQDSDTVLYAACSPCQPFSTLNRLKANDARKNLLLTFCDLVEKKPPHFIVVENVPMLKTVYGKTIYEEFVRRIRACGFNDVIAEFMNAADYGVPQNRKRFILLASRLGPIRAPRKIKRVRTVRDALKKYPRVVAGRATKSRYKNHFALPLADNHKTIVAAVPKNGGRRQDIADQSILLPCHRGKPGDHRDVFARMSWHRPAPTLTSRCCDVYCGRFVHPSQNRGITLREAAALQSFSDKYVFFGTPRQIARQVGNAVPVAFAKRLGLSILSSYE